MKLAGILAVCCISCCLSGQVSAADEKSAYTTRARVSCDKYSADYDSAGRERELYRWWISGYLTAYNIWNRRGAFKVSGSADLESVMEWIKNYCDENPAATVTHGMGLLINELLAGRAPG